MARTDAGTNPAPQVAVDPALEERLRVLEARLRELQDRQERRPLALSQALLQRMLPAEAREHLRNAQREQLLAMRAIVDAALRRIEEGPGGRPRRVESVRIE